MKTAIEPVTAIILDNPIDEVNAARTRISDELSAGDIFAIPAKFSGGLCLCGEIIQEGEKITRIPLWNRWVHEKCANMERDKNKPKSKASILTDKLINQTLKTETVYKPDLIELARLSFLGKWSVDHWVEDQIITTKILDVYGLHRLTTGYRFGSDKMMKKYAQKIEKEFAKRRGWVCVRCKHTIWVKESVEAGMGPVCRKKHAAIYGGSQGGRARDPSIKTKLVRIDQDE